MVSARWLLLSTLLLVGDNPSRQTDVQVAGGRVTIEARNVPLAQLLDRLAEASGMTVTYEGGRPSTAVTVSVKGLSEVAAVVQLMEGLGISYFIRTDDSGSGVDVLIISGAAAGGGRVASGRTSAHVEAPAEEPVEVYEVPPDAAEAEAAAAAAAAAQGHLDPAIRYMGLPAQHFPSGASYP
jgi:hypothetical protein